MVQYFTHLLGAVNHGFHSGSQSIFIVFLNVILTAYSSNCIFLKSHKERDAQSINFHLKTWLFVVCLFQTNVLERHTLFILVYEYDVTATCVL